MSTELAIPEGFKELLPQQQKEHRAKIGVRAEAILRGFWRDESPSDAVRALELEGWMDVLENCSHSEIRKAWAEYQKTGPRTQSGKLYKPDAGALYLIIINSRPKPKVVQLNPEPLRKPLTQEEIEKRRFFSNQILQGAGYKLRPSTGIEDMPTQQGQEIIRQTTEKHGVTIDEVKSAQRPSHIVLARDEIAYRLNEELKWSHPRIAIALNKDPSSIWTAVERYKARQSEVGQ